MQYLKPRAECSRRLDSHLAMAATAIMAIHPWSQTVPCLSMCDASRFSVLLQEVFEFLDPGCLAVWILTAGVGRSHRLRPDHDSSAPTGSCSLRDPPQTPSVRRRRPRDVLSRPAATPRFSSAALRCGPAPRLALRQGGRERGAAGGSGEGDRRRQRRAGWLQRPPGKGEDLRPLYQDLAFFCPASGQVLSGD